MTGEDWKESAVTRRDVLRYILMKDRLLTQLPWYQTPVECYMENQVNDCEYVLVNGGAFGKHWIKREQIEVVAILPPLPKPQAKGPADWQTYFGGMS